jgi:beta-glucosidase
MNDPNPTCSTFDDARAAVANGLEPEEAAQRLAGSLTAEEMLWLLDGDAPCWAGLDFLGKNGYHQAPFHAARVPRVGLPGFSFSDGPRGVVIGDRTCFPVSMARGATWDPDLEERVGEAIGIELRAAGATLYGGVCVNLLRHPAWGRAQETYGEDPHHVGEMGAALTRGVQRHAMACVKHYACNSMENARFRVDVTIDEVALHEVYLPHFKRIVDEGVASVMTAYNSVNGEWCGENAPLLADILRGEWGFDGFVITDWIFGLRDAAKSLAAGLDVEMPYRMVRAERLAGALDEGRATWDDVRAVATRLIATLLRFADVVDAPAVVDSVVHRQLARLVAARSVVLLRNEEIDGVPLLPLSVDTRPTVGVFGQLAATVNVGDGGSSDVWALDCVTVIDGLRTAAPDLDIEHDPGDDVVRAAQHAAAVDVAVVVVGCTYEDEGEFIGDAGAELMSLFPGADDPALVVQFQEEIAGLPPLTVPGHIAVRPSSLGFATGGDRISLRLAAGHVELIRAVAGANPRTIVVLQGGSAILSGEWDQAVPSIVQAWYGGEEAGSGLADVVFGVVNPSGRLPFSVPADEAHLPFFDREADHAVYDRWHGWWHLERAGHAPAYPFGFGLSYTTFELGDLAATVSGDTVRIDGSLANTGIRDGADVIQVYAGLPDPEAPRRLVGFTRVEAAAGTTQSFSVRFERSALAQRDTDTHAWTVPVGSHVLEVGRHAGDPQAKRITVGW